MRVMMSKKIARKIMCGFMGLVVALSMCVALVPQKALAAGAVYVMKDGSKLTSTSDWENILLIIDGISSASSVSYDVSTKTLTMNGMTADYFSGEITKFIVKGTCKVNTIYYPGTINVTMSGSNASLTIGKIHSDATGEDFTPSKAVAANMIKISGGKLSGEKIVAANKTTKTLKVNDLVREKGKTAATSATYQITSVKNRTVTFVKPAKNASGKVTVKDTVVLSDGKRYKVTAIGDKAFSSFKGKANITSLVFGQNIKKIGKKACYNCKNTKSITVKSAELTKKKNVGDDAFKKVNKNVKITIKLKKAYEKNTTKVAAVFKQKRVGYVKTWKLQ